MGQVQRLGGMLKPQLFKTRLTLPTSGTREHGKGQRVKNEQEMQKVDHKELCFTLKTLQVTEEF